MNTINLSINKQKLIYQIFDQMFQNNKQATDGKNKQIDCANNL